MFRGSIVALVTPFKDGKVDEVAFADLINWLIGQGSDGFVPCGTTGESATLTHDEHARVVELCVEVVNRRVPVIAGAGSNSTAEAIRLTEGAAASGADGALLLSPYYNKPTQEGLYRHYRAVADAVDIPQFIYNIPGRTACELSPLTLSRLAEHKNIVGVKDAVGDLTKTSQVISLCGPEFIILSGDDALTFPMMALGARGSISALANIVPAEVAAMTGAMNEGDVATGRRLHFELMDLMEALFLETNPIPVKTALAMMKRIAEEFRLPLCEMSRMNREKLQTALHKKGLI